MDSFNVVQHVSGPTYISGDTLDLVFTYGVILDHIDTNEVVFYDHKSVSFNVSFSPEFFP